MIVLVDNGTPVAVSNEETKFRVCQANCVRSFSYATREKRSINFT